MRIENYLGPGSDFPYASSILDGNEEIYLKQLLVIMESWISRWTG
jgi:hypothetical protein